MFLCTTGGGITIGQAVKPGYPFGSLAAVANPKDGAVVATAAVTTVKPTTTTVALFASAATTAAVASGKCK